MLDKVISGCQTGVDQAALYAAQECGIPAGGFVTRGCKTLAGKCPELIEKFGLIELPTDSYAVRTRRNVRESDATLRIANDFLTPGERCTLTAIKNMAKEYHDVQAHLLKEARSRSHAEEWVAAWILEKNVRVLNVAGNAESMFSNVGLTVLARDFLVGVFRRVKS